MLHGVAWEEFIAVLTDTLTMHWAPQNSDRLPLGLRTSRSRVAGGLHPACARVLSAVGGGQRVAATAATASAWASSTVSTATGAAPHGAGGSVSSNTRCAGRDSNASSGRWWTSCTSVADVGAAPAHTTHVRGYKVHR